SRTIIADTSCLIVLANIGRLTLLNSLFGTILVTSAVSNEYGTKLPKWIEVRPVSNDEKFAAIGLILDPGEASSIALAFEVQDPILIIDEKKARRIAKDFGLTVIGTIAVLLKAKEQGLIDSGQELISSLENADFRF